MSDNVSAKAARRAEEEKALHERKKYKLTVICVVAVVAVLVVFVALFSSNLFYNGTTALSVGGMDFTVADFNYNYFTVYNSYYSSIVSSYGSSESVTGLMLPSTSMPFRDQPYFGSEDQTWADYLEEAAISRMKNMAILVSAAEAEGYTLPADEAAAVEDTISSLSASAVSYGYKDLNAYLAINYGKGMNEKVFRQCLTRDALAGSYSQHKSDSFSFTADEITDYYAQHADDNDYFKYRYYSFSGAAVSDDASTTEDESVSAEDATAKAKADADADAFLAAVTDEQSFMDYAASLNADSEGYDADSATLRTLQGSTIADVIKEWLCEDGRKEGDVGVVKSPDDATTTYYYVVYYIGRDNNQYNAFSGSYGLITDGPSTEDGSTPDESAIKIFQETNARAILDYYNAAPTKDSEAFAVAISEGETYLSDSGDITAAGKYDVPEELAEWFSDPARVEGDAEVIYVEGTGTFIVYFSKLDGVYADLMAEAQLRSDSYTQWEESQGESFENVTRHWQMGLSKKITSLGG